MFNIASVELDWKGLALKLETNDCKTSGRCSKMLTWWDSCFMHSLGLRTLMSLMTFSFIYIEKSYSAGKIPGDSLKEKDVQQKMRF